MRCVKLLGAVVAAVLVMASSAPAAVLTGTDTMYFHSHWGTGPGITIDVGGNQVSTGTLRYDLDPTYPKNSYMKFDFDNNTVEMACDLTVSGANFAANGLAPVRVHLAETGTFTSTPYGTDEDILESTLSGSLAVSTGSVFDGWTWTNDENTRTRRPRRPWPPLSPWPPLPPVWLFLQETANGQATSPLGGVYFLTFSGGGSGGPEPIPEPSALIIWSLLGGLGIIVATWRRQGERG